MTLNLDFQLFFIWLALIIILISQEGEDAWEDDSSVSESSSIYSSRQGPDRRIREFNNPHYNDGDSGKSFHLSYTVVNSLINIMVF